MWVSSNASNTPNNMLKNETILVLPPTLEIRDEQSIGVKQGLLY